MRFSIGHRLFVSVLLAILLVAASAVLLMRHNVMDSFGDYAVNIELDRLEELSGGLSRRYRENGGWQFLPQQAAARQAWIAMELTRLQTARGLAVPPPPPLPPEPDAPPPPPMPGAPFVAPPLPPPVIAAPRPVRHDDTDQLDLQDRITLTDAAGRYLAGRSLAGGESARRVLVAHGKPIGYLVVAKGSRPSDAMAGVFQERVRDSLLIIVAASVILSALAAMLLAAHFRKPILRLAGGAKQLAEGHYDTRLPATRSDELGDLAASFNELAAKLDQVEASRRQWVADTSHELRTPLAVLRAQLEAMQDGVRPATAENLGATLCQVLALNKLIDQLYALARADVGELDCVRTPSDVWTLACDHAAAFSERFASASITFDIASAPQDCTAAVDADRLRQVLTNVFENCIRYCGPGSRVAMSARGTTGRLELIIDDSGPGVPDDALPHLAERFYRVDASRSRAHGGAGLGLSLSQRIMEAHGGGLTFARSPLGGLQVRISMARA